MSSLTAAEINLIAAKINIYGGFLIWILGLVGNTLIIFTLTTTKQLRSNTCSIFMVATSGLNIGILIFQLGMLIVGTFIGFYPRSTFPVWCKVFAYTYYFPVYVSITLLALATIDRWLSTSRTVRLRSYSSINNVRLTIGVVCFGFGLLLIPHIIYSQVLFDPTRNSTKCDRPDGIYKTYVNYGLVPFVHVASIIIMIIFGFLTYRNLAGDGHVKRDDRCATIKQQINIQMTRSLFIQILSFIFCIVPNFIITILYPPFTANIIQRSAERIAIELLTNDLSMLLYYITFANTFYIFLIVSPTFRRNVKIFIRCQQSTNQVIPHVTTTRN